MRTKRVGSSKRPTIPTKITRLDGIANKSSNFERTKNMGAFPIVDLSLAPWAPPRPNPVNRGGRRGATDSGFQPSQRIKSAEVRAASRNHRSSNHGFVRDTNTQSGLMSKMHDIEFADPVMKCAPERRRPIESSDQGAREGSDLNVLSTDAIGNRRCTIAPMSVCSTHSASKRPPR